MIIGIYFSFSKGFDDGSKTKDYFERAASTLLNYEIASDQDLSRLYPSNDFLREQAAFLKKTGL